jgi:hypothetical protein
VKTPTTACKRRHQSTWLRLQTPMNCVLTEYCLPCGRQSEMPSLLNEWWEHTSSCVPTIFVLVLTCHIYRQPVGKGQVANICASAPFPQHDKHPRFTAISQIHQSTKIGSTNNGSLTASREARGGALVEASRKVAGSIPDGAIGISH